MPLFKSCGSILLSGLMFWVSPSFLGLSLSYSQSETTTENPESGLFAPPQTLRGDDGVPRPPSPPPFDPLTSKQFNLYRLDVGDGVSVTVRDFDEFSFSGLVDPEGNLFVPILGRIPVIGLSLDEVETKVAFELGQKYLQNEPEVVALLTGVRPVDLTIIGEVVRPGYYAFAQGISLNQVVAQAGGSTPQADLRSIVVRRALVDGAILEEEIDLYTPLIQGKSLPLLQLQGGDTVIVNRLNPETVRDYDRAVVARTTLTQQTITVRVLIHEIPSGRRLQNVNLPNGSTFIDLVGILPGGDRLRLKQNEVTLLRFDPDLGRVVTQSLNPESLVLEGDIPQNVLLRDQDVIITSRTLLGEIFAAFNIITQPIRDLFSFTDFFRRFTNGNGRRGF